MDTAHTPDQCPKCGSRELGRGKQNGYAVMTPVSKIRFGSAVEFLLCTDCGFILESYVSNPEKFKGTL
ncbi:hypothetical protein [Sporosarcina koreensis]|uniref:hypothetical protein n=1 Tax=Sporosarcina koreensis TaxID=334735 RepID=UPI00058DCA1E|nr:hypothetical protein [Sporosarcina koreensis]